MVRQRVKRSDEATTPMTQSEGLVIPEEEQWRLIRESGILQKVETPQPKLSSEDPEEFPLGEEIFNTSLLVIPFSFLLLMMDILIHYQYGKEPPLWELVERMLTGIPILSVFIFYTARYKLHRRMQFLLFVLAAISGCRMIYIINHKSWLVNMRQCPPLATLWIYAIVQLELSPAVISLMTVGVFVWWNGLRIAF